jgi:hypothetical protein
MKYLILLILAFSSCVPAEVKATYTFSDLEPAKTTELSNVFQPVFQQLGIRIGGGKAFRYEGKDDRAFLATIDRFYLEHPGFCPLQDAFFVAPDQSLYMTLAAKDFEVAAFIYDQSRRPSLIFAYLGGKSIKKIPTIPCRTAVK